MNSFTIGIKIPTLNVTKIVFILHSQKKLGLVVESFNQLFLKTENTLLKGGSEEPFYQAATESLPAIIYFRENFLSSALHEIAHWCIAGIKRRKKNDFGYWYRPEGRNLQEQEEFENVETKPQAIEWAFSLACEHEFHFSADNLLQGIDASNGFKSQVTFQLKYYLKGSSGFRGNRLPQRAGLFFNQLNLIFRDGKVLELSDV